MVRTPSQVLQQLCGVRAAPSSSSQSSALLAAKTIALKKLQNNAYTHNSLTYFKSLLQLQTPKTLYAYLLHGVGASLAFVTFIKLSRYLLNHLP